jgi:hypothetical protein
MSEDKKHEHEEEQPTAPVVADEGGIPIEPGKTGGEQSGEQPVEPSE